MLGRAGTALCAGAARCRCWDRCGIPADLEAGVARPASPLIRSRARVVAAARANARWVVADACFGRGQRCGRRVCRARVCTQRAEGGVFRGL